jgi:predicted Zn-dependent protease
MLSVVRRLGILYRASVLLIGAALIAAPPKPGASPRQEPLLLDTLAAELDRNFQVLKQKADPAPYFISYGVTEEEAQSISASQGAVQSSGRGLRRQLDCSVRVGSRQFDNYHLVDGDRPRGSASAPLPVEDAPAALNRVAWRVTDTAWRAASQRYLRVRTAVEAKPKDAQAVDDFSEETPLQAVQAVPASRLSVEEWSARLRKLSAGFAGFSGVISSSVSLNWRREVRTFLSTEGSRISHGRTYISLSIVAKGKSYDGYDLVTMESFEAEDPSRLPKDDALAAAVQKAGNDLVKLIRCQPADPYVGPAILSGRAAGVFFHEIFGHRIEGHRQKDETEGQTFSASVGKSVLPDFLSIISDPTRKSAGSVDLNGWYAFDDEGVAARPVQVVENGILKTFLLSRAPIAGFPHSNGHGRRQPGMEAVSRQSNLIVESARQMDDAGLRKLLVEEVVRQKKPYGLYFEQVTGGYTTTRRAGLQAFTVIPLVVYRVYADGRPDEIVRGADIVGTPLASFAKILATGNAPAVFNGYCGAESGSIPVSAVSPALLVGEIEIQRKPQSNDLPPLLPRPQFGVAR